MMSKIGWVPGLVAYFTVLLQHIQILGVLSVSMTSLGWVAVNQRTRVVWTK